MEKTINLKVNGQPRRVITNPDRPLLEVLREEFNLTGTKFGCGEGKCGACTVLDGGKGIHSCITPIGDMEGSTVLTIEGLADGDKLHPVQEAFLAAGASQCGYCTPGMIMAVVGLLTRSQRPTETEILSRMEGNLCRCCNYARLRTAIERSAALVGRGQ